MIRGPEFEYLTTPSLKAAPFICCYFCRHVMKEGELVNTVSIENPWKYGKQRKKLAKSGLLFRTHMAHAGCPK